MSATKQWFVLRVGTNREKRVKKQLNSRIAQNDLGELISEILVVTERVTEIKAGNRRTVERKVYPGYVMAEIVVDYGSIEMGSLEDIFGMIDEEPKSPAEAFEQLAPPVDNRAPEQPGEAPLS